MLLNHYPSNQATSLVIQIVKNREFSELCYIKVLWREKRDENIGSEVPRRQHES
jgi:hypothetical protein